MKTFSIMRWMLFIRENCKNNVNFFQEIEKKLGDGQQPRFPEEEGMYIGIRPSVQSKIQNKLENRLG
jgi:hypothetical protein